MVRAQRTVTKGLNFNRLQAVPDLPGGNNWEKELGRIKRVGRGPILGGIVDTGNPA